MVRLPSITYSLLSFSFCFFGHIVKRIVIFDNTGADLDERIFTNERIHDRLEDT